jgi:DNA-binding LytR/AlgR family response regulator
VHLIDRAIGEMEELLKPAGFVRINRSELVNLEHVLEMAPWTSGTWRISVSAGAYRSASSPTGCRRWSLRCDLWNRRPPELN